MAWAHWPSWRLAEPTWSRYREGEGTEAVHRQIRTGRREGAGDSQSQGELQREREYGTRALDDELRTTARCTTLTHSPPAARIPFTRASYAKARSTPVQHSGKISASTGATLQVRTSCMRHAARPDCAHCVVRPISRCAVLRSRPVPLVPPLVSVAVFIRLARCGLDVRGSETVILLLFLVLLLFSDRSPTGAGRDGD